MESILWKTREGKVSKESMVMLEKPSGHVPASKIADFSSIDIDSKTDVTLIMTSV